MKNLKTKQKILSKLMLALSCVVLAACSGSGGSDEPTPKPDTKEPSVVSVSPDNGAKIAKKPTITVTFSENVKGVINTNVSLTKSGAAASVALTIAGSGKTYTIKPNADLKVGASYTLTLKKAITDSAGNKLVSDVSKKYTVSTNPDPVPDPTPNPGGGGTTDTTAPTVSASPASGALGGDTDKTPTITLTFSETVKNVKATNVELKKTGATNPVVLTIGGSGKVYTVKPNTNLEAGSYTLTLKVGITDNANNPLASAQSYSYTVTYTPEVSIVTPMTLFKTGGKVRISGKNLSTITPVFDSANIQPTKRTDNLIEITLPPKPVGQHRLTLNGKHYDLTYRGAYTKVSSGHNFSCGLLPDKTVECWGRNGSYELGNGTGLFMRNHSYKPDFVKAPKSINKLTNITDISVGFDHSCAVNTSGKVLCWGAAGGKGKRGDNKSLSGTDYASSNFVFAAAGTHLSGVSKVVAAKSHSCALMTDKTVKCWGDAGDYRVGSGSGAAWLPTTVPGVSNVIELAAGNDHTCALKSDKTVMCWGVNSKGQLGKAVSTSSAPSAVSGLANVKQIAANQHNTCALLTDKTVKCWGNNDQGQVGNGVRGNTPVSTPTTVIKAVGSSSPLSNVAKISVGHAYSCALLENGAAKCWGRNSSYQLGDGTRANRLVPVYVKSGSGYLSNVTDISAAFSHTCAATKDSLLKCWGDNSNGQLGDTTSVTSSAPVDIAIAGSKKQPLSNVDNVKQVAAGPHHSCAVLHDKTVKCWGRNDNAQIGSGAVTTGTGPQPPVSVGNINNAVYVSAGEKHSCALLEDKTVKCWGRDQNGATGNPNRVGATQTLVPATVTALSNVVQLVVAKGTHSCALLADSKVKCWGENSAGQLGNNAQSAPFYSGTPVYVHTSETDSTPLSGVKQIAAGIKHTCAVLNDNTVKCWGYGGNGELGSNPASAGTGYVKRAPTLVGGLTNIKQVVAGAKHSCALYNTLKHIRCWGQQENGVLGNGFFRPAIIYRPTDVRFLALTTGETITKLSAGFYHNCALIGDSKVGCWGMASSKQLADDEIRMTYRREAVEGKIFDGKIEDLSLGNEYSLFLQGSLITTTKD